MTINKNNLILIGALFLSTIASSLFCDKSFATPANPAFTDDTFYECIVSSYNRRTGASESVSTSLTDAQLARIDVLTCASLDLNNISGIQKLTGLKDAYLHENNLTTIDLTLTPTLEWVWLNRNNLTSIKLNEKLMYLEAKHNKLSTLIIPTNSRLTHIDLEDNPLTSLDVSHLSDLQTLNISESKIKRLDVKNNPILTWLNVNNDTLINANIVTTENNGSYTVNIHNIVTNELSGDTPGFILRSTITNTNYYTYDSATDIITITNPDAINGFIEVGNYKLLVPINELIPEEDDSEAIVVPNTSSNTSSIATPDTGINQKISPKEISPIFSIWTLLLIIIPIIIKCYIVRSKEHKRFD